MAFNSKVSGINDEEVKLKNKREKNALVGERNTICVRIFEA